MPSSRRRRSSPIWQVFGPVPAVVAEAVDAAGSGKNGMGARRVSEWMRAGASPAAESNAAPALSRAELKQVAIVSGKGGTGKTSIAASFAALATEKVLADCDVDAANLHLLLHPEVRQRQEFHGAKVAFRDASACRACGECERRCRFAAITREKVDVHACQGCGLCVLACPNHALALETVACGEFFLSDSRYGPMAHARLYPGGESSGHLVTEVRRHAEVMAMGANLRLILIDGPPGIGCSATAALVDVDLAVVVTEPTPAAQHDMLRLLLLLKHFGIPAAVILNKADLDDANRQSILQMCEAMGATVIAQVPFDDAVTRAIAAGRPLIEVDEGPAARAIQDAWAATCQLLECATI